ncbi:fibronectin-binding protein A [Lucilia cuprina]|uniref:fibronectin-binding protein A n=1 Tax=Lucilia cuprina TaxID=7375 RepID=UPI001F05ED08|nr:fibronectin-binding protein A [Lucilia cuprina]
MAKFYTTVVIIAIALALVAAEPPRFRQSKRFGSLKIKNNRKVLARQEQASEAALSSAPYPPAGVTPEIPFDLPTETEAPVAEPADTYGPPEPTPDQTYGPPEQTPDETYGPPEPTPDETYGPPEAEEVPAITEPDNTYGPPTTDDQPAIEEPEAEEIPQSESNLVSENLIQPRNKNIRARSRSAPLRSRVPAKRSRSAALRQRSAPVQPRFNTVEIIHSEPVLIYTLH